MRARVVAAEASTVHAPYTPLWHRGCSSWAYHVLQAMASMAGRRAPCDHYAQRLGLSAPCARMGAVAPPQPASGLPTRSTTTRVLPCAFATQHAVYARSRVDRSWSCCASCLIRNGIVRLLTGLLTLY